MVDRRAATGTKTLQTAWSALALLALGAAAVGRPALIDATTVAAGGGAWLLGLVVLGWRERRAWNRLVAGSGFERQSPGSMADLHRIVKGHTVTVATDVPGLLSQTHTVVATTVEGVDADLRIDLKHVGAGGGDAGHETGNPALDAAWVIDGSDRNVDLLLSADVQSGLMDVAVPARIEITRTRVTCRVPFTRLTAAELATLAECVATIAERMERLGRGEASPTA